MLKPFESTFNALAVQPLYAYTVNVLYLKLPGKYNVYMTNALNRLLKSTVLHLKRTSQQFLLSRFKADILRMYEILKQQQVSHLPILEDWACFAPPLTEPWFSFFIS